MPVSTLMVAVLAAAAAASALPAPPALRVPACPDPLPAEDADWSALPGFASPDGPFLLSDGVSGPAAQQTRLAVCHRRQASRLVAHYWAVDGNITAPYARCNQPLYEHSAVEMFVAAAANRSSPPPHEYLELEVAPTAALFAARVRNPRLVCRGIEDTLLPCNETGVAQAAGLTPRGWWATLDVPLALAPGAGDGALFRANFFRIDTPPGKAKEYSCWSPTGATPPCFHVPPRFGWLELV